MSNDNRNCIMCRHWCFDTGDFCGSPYTPGDDWSSFCAKNRWHHSLFGKHITESDWREAIAQAVACDLFDLAGSAQ